MPSHERDTTLDAIIGATMREARGRGWYTLILCARPTADNSGSEVQLYGNLDEEDVRHFCEELIAKIDQGIFSTRSEIRPT